MKRQSFVIEMTHQFRDDEPDVPISSAVNLEKFTQRDTEAGRKPCFITLPLGEHGQMSRNNRRYVDGVAIQAIESAINEQRVGGDGGHLPDHDFSAPPILHWVGAVIQDDVVWGKAYVPGDSERMREWRGYYERQAAAKSPVATSLKGEGILEWNDELEVWDVTELEVLAIDAVRPKSMGVEIAGSRPPTVTTEVVEPGDLESGDFVAWESKGERIRGQVNTIWEEGEVEVPWNDDAPPLMASPENPVARMDVYRPSWESGEWVRTDQQEVRYFNDLTKIDRLPEMKEAAPDDLDTGDFVRWDSSGGTAQGRIDTIERDGVIDVPDSDATIEGTSDNPATLITLFQESDDGWMATETQVGYTFSTLTKIDPLNEPTNESVNEDGDDSMPDKDVLKLTDADLQERIDAAVNEALDEQRQRHERTVTELNATISELREQAAMLNRIESLLDDSETPVATVESLVDERDTLRDENSHLLETAITSLIEDEVEIDFMRPGIRRQVEMENPTTMAEVKEAVENVLNDEENKASLKEALKVAGGPNVQGSYSSDSDDDAADVVTYG